MTGGKRGDIVVVVKQETCARFAAKGPSAYVFKKLRAGSCCCANSGMVLLGLKRLFPTVR